MARISLVLGRNYGINPGADARHGLYVQSLRTEGNMMNSPKRSVLQVRLALVVVLCTLVGCGAEVASTTATSAKLQATQAEQAKAQEALFKKQLGKAMQATEAAASAAGNQ